MMEVAFLVGRLMLGGYFLMAGFNHLFNLKSMAGYASSKGVPAPHAAVSGTGLILILGGFSILLGAYTVVGVALLVIFLVGASVGDPQLLESERPAGARRGTDSF